MKHFLPHFIQEHYRHGLWNGRMQACVLFVDLSGFTRLTDRLMQQGPEGAEELSYILNHIFQPTIRLVYEQGGFIPYFAGDSFTALFPISEKETIAEIATRTLHTSQTTLQRFLYDQQLADSIVAEHRIGIKIGLSVGEVEWGIVGQRRKGFYFRGKAIESSALAQTRARSLEVLCDADFLALEIEDARPLDRREGGYFALDMSSVPLAPLGVRPVHLPEPDPAIIAQFMPLEAFAQNNVGEFRNVVSLFLSFSGLNTHDTLDLFASIVLEQSLNFGGYFKEIDFGDKGGLMCCLFGAPVSFENNTERALEFVVALQEELQSVVAFTGARYRIGISAGLAFTGVIGSFERCQYAAVGARVNLAARLMARADWGEVIADENVQHTRNFKFTFRGEEKYKGFEQKIPTYLLSGRNLAGRVSFSGECFGRENELKTLQAFAAPLREGRFVGIAFVFGEAGIGKSRLSYELRRSLRDVLSVSWLHCQSDQILRKPFNPFIYLLKNYFEQSPENSPERNRERFESNFLELTYELSASKHPEADAVQREILRTQSILAALVGLHMPGSLWEQLDARGRYQNALSAMANLFVAEAILRPVVIELEDTHWFDDMSREFLGQFIRRAQAYPILFLATSRYEDDGSKNYVLRLSLLQEIGVPHLEIDLNYLQADDLRAFAEARLGGPIHPELMELLQRMTQGNPFYLEQMAEYFQEANLLENASGAWRLKNQDVHLSDSVKQIMMARIDRLSGLVKETVKAAAVIGHEFELPVLSAVMARQEEFIRRNGDLDSVLREQVQMAEKWQIWYAMNELRYIFRHSLLREAAYDMQLRTRLRELHQLIAEAIEQLYPHSEERYVDLAFHYEQAENEEKTAYYLEKAARYAQRNFQNRQAIQYYGKLLRYLSDKPEKAEKCLKLHLRKGAVHELIGQWQEAEEEYRTALNLAKRLQNTNFLGHSHRRLGQLLVLRGNYEGAKKHLDVAIHCFEITKNEVGLAETYGNLGNYFFRQGNYTSAQSWFAKAIEINRSLQRDSENASIVATLGLIYMNQGHYDEGIRWLEEQLDTAQRNEDKQAQTILYTNLGIVYLEKGSLDSALLCLEKGLALAEELGNKLFATICIGSIGSVWEKKGDFDKAMELFQRDLALCLELGDKQGLAIANGLIGDLLSLMGDFNRSIEYSEKALALSRELNYKKGIAKALNTLADNWYHKGDLARALSYYTEAIEQARSMGNRLILGHSLLEKGAAELRAGNLPAARLLLEEGREIALTLGNSELIFAANLLRTQILIAEGNHQDALRQLLQLQPLARTEREQASIHYELRRVAENPQLHRLQALKLYQALYQRTPRYLFKVRIAELEQEGACT
ncbi:MAG: tetratricopeptide repeat protein [Saprospiraceae bacterium]|nr:tetratricopeptide repeat protein [Saprospiraceae bacterium]MDW8485327.1 tetratricopeptide repeat protein [Saprospiraceae bacterium]